MGFEITYHFYDKRKEGVGYDVENPQKVLKKIGKMEEVPLEDLASQILSQLARRDIMVFDVEIQEYVKKKVSFRESGGSIVIKNKKFTPGKTIVVEDESVQDEVLPQQEKTVSNGVHKPEEDVIVRHEYFSGTDQDSVLLARRKIYVKSGGRYPILKERESKQKVIGAYGIPTDMAVLTYDILDDTNNKVNVPSIYFEPVKSNFQTSRYDSNLDVSDAPVLRRG